MIRKKVKSQKNVSAPFGIKLISILYYASALLLLLIVLLMVLRNSLLVDSALAWIEIININLLHLLGVPFTFIGMIALVIGFASAFIYSMVFILIAGLYFWTGHAITSSKQGARKAVLVLSCISIGFGILSTIFYFVNYSSYTFDGSIVRRIVESILLIPVPAVVLWYFFSKETKSFFAQK